MPIRKKMPNRHKRKRTKKHVTISDITKQEIGKSLGFPRVKRVKMKYCDAFTLTSTTGVLNTLDFGANDVFDPYLGFGGHQPMGYDNLMLYYNHCYVISSAIKLTVVNQSGANILPVVGVYLSDDQTNYTVYTAFNETNRGSQKLMTLSGAKTQVTAKYNHSSFFRGRPNGAAEFLNTPASGPSEKAVFTLYLQDCTVTDTCEVSGFVEIVYEVEFSEPRDIAQS